MRGKRLKARTPGARLALASIGGPTIVSEPSGLPLGPTLKLIQVRPCCYRPATTATPLTTPSIGAWATLLVAHVPQRRTVERDHLQGRPR